MKDSPVSSADLIRVGRLDAGYYLSGAGAIRSRIAAARGVSQRTIGSFARVYAPSRFKRTYAVSDEDSVPYLRPYDVFEYLPPEADRLSVSRTAKLDDYRIYENDILQTCSGRNLGPVTIADSYLAQFVLSHDMIRITVDDQTQRLYLLAFLRSRTGQALLRSDRGGSVISHIGTDHVAALDVPFADRLVEQIALDVKKAVDLRGQARQVLHDALDALNDAYPSPTTSHCDGWTVNAAHLFGRFDAAFHSEQVTTARNLLADAGGTPLGDVASVTKPGGRPKLVYVDAEHGSPFLSGRQILQADLVAAKYLARNNASIDERFELEPGMVIFQADGRAEESLGYPSLVAHDRAGWLASGHVGRAKPIDRADAGWLWTSMASDVVRSQVAALSCGSVVDALYPEDLETVILPPRDMIDSAAVGRAWSELAESSELLHRASSAIDDALA